MLSKVDVVHLLYEQSEKKIPMKELDISELPKFIAIEAGYDWEERKKLLFELGYNIDFYQFNNKVIQAI